MQLPAYYEVYPSAYPVRFSTCTADNKLHICVFVYTNHFISNIIFKLPTRLAFASVLEKPPAGSLGWSVISGHYSEPSSL